MNIKAIVEVLLFSADRPLKTREMAEIADIDVKEVRKALKALTHEYNERQSAMEVVRVGQRYIMQVQSDYLEYAYKVGRPELNEDVLKTLAVIAYYQPIRQSDLRMMLGEKVYAHVNKLRGKNLIYMRRTGKTYEISTTKYFSEYFGIDATSKTEIKEYLAKKLNMVMK